MVYFRANASPLSGTADVPELDDKLAAKADTNHTQLIDSVVDLRAELDTLGSMAAGVGAGNATANTKAELDANTTALSGQVLTGAAQGVYRRAIANDPSSAWVLYDDSTVPNLAARVAAVSPRTGFAGPPGMDGERIVKDPAGRVAEHWTDGVPNSTRAGVPKTVDGLIMAQQAAAAMFQAGFAGPADLGEAVRIVKDPSGRVAQAFRPDGSGVDLDPVEEADTFEALPAARLDGGDLVLTDDDGSETTITPRADWTIESVAEIWAPRANGGKGRPVYKGLISQGGAPARPMVWNRTMSLVALASSTAIILLFGTGQSNGATHTVGDPVRLTEQPYRGWNVTATVSGVTEVRGQANTNPLVNSLVDIPNFTGLGDHIAMPGVAADTGQSFLDSAAVVLQRAFTDELGHPVKIFSFMGATGGAPISALDEGSPAFENIIAVATKLRGTFWPAPKLPVVVPFLCAYGESNMNTPIATYKPAVELARQHFSTRLSAALGITVQVMFIHLVPYSSFSYEGHLANQALLELSTDVGTRAYHKVIGGRNDLTNSSGDADGLHLNNLGQQHAGEIGGRAILNQCFSNTPWEPFAITAVTRTGAQTLRVRLAVPVGGLVFNAGRLGLQETIDDDDMPSPWGVQGAVCKGFHIAQQKTAPEEPDADVRVDVTAVELGPADGDGHIRVLDLTYAGTLRESAHLGHAAQGYPGLEPGTISPGDPNADPPVPPDPPVRGRASRIEGEGRPAFCDECADVSYYDGKALPNWPVPQWWPLAAVVP